MAYSRFLILAWVMAYVQGHGYVADPPNRASLWRYGYDAPRDVDDNGLNCGGVGHQYRVNGGKCGICGDPYDAPQPRAHELGGRYGLGIIVAHYQPGQVINTSVNLTAAHLGFWELRICTDPYYQEQECFDNGYLLELEDGGTKYYPKRGSTSYNVNYRLPEDLTCEHCVLQWRYTGGNNWRNQEQFFSCSDISIGHGLGSESKDTSTAEPKMSPKGNSLMKNNKRREYICESD